MQRHASEASASTVACRTYRYHTLSTVEPNNYFSSPASRLAAPFLCVRRIRSRRFSVIKIQLHRERWSLVSARSGHAPRTSRRVVAAPAVMPFIRKAAAQMVTCAGIASGRAPTASCAISATPRRTWAIARRRPPPPAAREQSSLSFNNTPAGMPAFDIVTKPTVTVGQCQHGSCIDF